MIFFFEIEQHPTNVQPTLAIHMYIPCTLFFFFGFVGMLTIYLLKHASSGTLNVCASTISSPNCNTLLSHRIFLFYFAIPVVLRVFTVIKKKLFL